MLFTARSLAFCSPKAPTSVTSIAHAKRLPAHLPWFVATFLRTDDVASQWETACTSREQDLLDHLKSAGDIQVAELLYMAPPVGDRKWARHYIYRIEKGSSDEGEFSIYTDSGGHEFCFASPELDLELVKKRKVVLCVQHWRHFD